MNWPQTCLRPAVVIALACAARAQLIVGQANTNAPPTIWHIDVATGERTALFQSTAMALAVDDVGGFVYTLRVDGQLTRWAYGSGLPPVVLGPVTGAGGDVIALAFGAGRMFGASTGGFVIEINPTTLAATPIALSPQLHHVEGLSYDAPSGLFFAVDESTQADLYSIDLLNGGNPVLIAYINWDGDSAAVGGGRVYVMPDGAASIATYDLASGAFAANALWNPYAGFGFECGSEWAPNLVPPAAPRVYCQPKPGPAACLPRTLYAGSPSASAGSGFVISNIALRDNAAVQPVYSLNGQAFAPLYGGWRCINTPLRRMPLLNAVHDTSGNVAASCDSRVDIDFNAVIASGFDPALVAGQQVCLQLLVRDGSFANGINLTPGIEFTVGP